MKQERKGIVLLFLVTAIWGLSFPLVKLGVLSNEPYLFAAMRFDIAFACLALISLFRKVKVKFATVRSGFFLGAVLFVGYACQTIGLQYTSATNSAFLTGVSVIFVPIFAWMFLREKISIKVFNGVVLASVGLFFLSGGSFFELNRGDWFTLGSAIAFAVQILMVSRMASHHDPLLLTTFQMLAVAIASHGMNCFFETSNLLTPDFLGWVAAAVLGIFANAFALTIQILIQRSVTAVTAALIFITEPLWGALAGYFLSGDRLQFINYFGGALMILGLLVVETPPLPKFLRPRLRPQ